MTSAQNNGESLNGLTKLVKRFIDFLWYATIASLVVWLVMTFVIGLNIPEVEQQRHTDIDFFFSFAMYPDSVALVEQPSKLSEVIQGQGEIKLNNTQGVMSWYLSSVFIFILGFIGLAGIAYSRKLFTNLMNQQFFVSENYKNVQMIGYVCIVWHIVYPLLTFAGGWLILQEVGTLNDALILKPAFPLSLVGIFTGLAIVVIAQVFKEAIEIHQENELTI